MIEPVLLSEMILPEGHPRAGNRCPVFGFVIWHRDGPVLVDTGVGRGHPFIDGHYAPRHRDLDDALTELGIHRGDVVMVINSHLHFDHCGNNPLFSGVPIVAQRIEYESAHQPRYTVEGWVDFPGAQWDLAHGEAEVLSGITVVPTPGHTPGHQSVLVETPDGSVVIAAQAVYDPGELEAEASTEPLTAEEAETTSVSARALKALEPITVHFSHHPGTWPGTGS